MTAENKYYRVGAPVSCVSNVALSCCVSAKIGTPTDTHRHPQTQTDTHTDTHRHTQTPVFSGGICRWAGQILLSAFIVLEGLKVHNLHPLRLRAQVQDHHLLTLTQLKHRFTFMRECRDLKVGNKCSVSLRNDSKQTDCGCFYTTATTVWYEVCCWSWYRQLKPVKGD